MRPLVASKHLATQDYGEGDLNLDILGRRTPGLHICSDPKAQPGITAEAPPKRHLRGGGGDSTRPSWPPAIPEKLKSDPGEDMLQPKPQAASSSQAEGLLILVSWVPSL